MSRVHNDCDVDYEFWPLESLILGLVTLVKNEVYHTCF